MGSSVDDIVEGKQRSADIWPVTDFSVVVAAQVFTRVWIIGEKPWQRNLASLLLLLRHCVETFHFGILSYCLVKVCGLCLLYCLYQIN